MADSVVAWGEIAQPFADYYEALLRAGVEQSLAQTIILNFADNVHRVIADKIGKRNMGDK